MDINNLLLFKLLAIPLLIAIVSFIQKRYGHAIGGTLSGLPFVAGPISVFLAIEQGVPFARSAAPETLAALLGTSFYAVTYLTLAKSRPWYVCWISGIVMCLGVLYVQSLLALPVPVRIGMGVLAMIINTTFMSRIPMRAHAHPQGKWWDVPVRAVAVLIPLLLITALAHIIGPKYSGMFSSLPVFWTILFISTQLQWGYDALVHFFRGGVTGNYSMLAFFCVIIYAPIDNIAVLYLTAVFVTIVFSFFVNKNKQFFLKKRF